MNNLTSKTVIVPWDFSDNSKNALKMALEMVDSPSQIEVVHVTPYPSAVEPSVVWGTYSEDKIGENLLNSFREEVDMDQYPGLKFTTLFGDPGSQIADLAKQSDAGLIVVSSHGRTGLSRLLLGSVAERVVRISPCPVLVLRVNE